MYLAVKLRRAPQVFMSTACTFDFSRTRYFLIQWFTFYTDNSTMRVSCQSKLPKSSHCESPNLVYGHNDLEFILPEPREINLCGGDLMCQSSPKLSSAQKLRISLCLLPYCLLYSLYLLYTVVINAGVIRPSIINEVCYTPIATIVFDRSLCDNTAEIDFT